MFASGADLPTTPFLVVGFSFVFVIWSADAELGLDDRVQS